MSIKPWICNGSRTIIKDRWIDLHADAGALRGVIRGLNEPLEAPEVHNDIVLHPLEGDAGDSAYQLPLLHGEKAERDVFIEFGRYETDHDGFGGFQPMRCIYDGRFKLVINLLSEDELYDLESDPYELENRINNPDCAARRDALHARLLEHMNAVRDPLRGYYWECRPWNRHAETPSWDYTGSTRQKEEPDYEKTPLDYATGMPVEHLVRRKEKSAST